MIVFKNASKKVTYLLKRNGSALCSCAVVELFAVWLQQKLASMQGKRVLVVFDECHSLLEWAGFRKDFMNLDEFLVRSKVRPQVLCLTATLTSDKQTELFKYLGITDCYIATRQFNTHYELQQPTEPSKQPIRTRYLGHVTGNQPIRDQYFLIDSVGS
eukprot:sb/3473058/